MARVYNLTNMNGCSAVHVVKHTFMNFVFRQTQAFYNGSEVRGFKACVFIFFACVICLAPWNVIT